MTILPQTEPLTYPPDEPYYYADVAPTIRLSESRLDPYLPEKPWPIIIALFIIAAGAFRLGLLMASPFEYRGWAALLVFSIVGSVWIVHTRKGE